MSQQHPTCRNMSQHVAIIGGPNARNMLHAFGYLLRCVATCWVLKIELVRMPGCNIVARTWPNDYNIMQHPQMLHEKIDQFQAPAKRSQYLNVTYRNIVGHNMLRAFGHPVVMCCYTLGIENRTSAHARTQHCYTNLAKRLQHHATSTNVA